jgi:Cu(I)/Ag(I) efflux system membrane fusion protein
VIGAGAPLADILVPDWVGAQAEYLAVRRSGNAALASAARQRLALLGMPGAPSPLSSTAGGRRTSSPSRHQRAA